MAGDSKTKAIFEAKLTEPRVFFNKGKAIEWIDEMVSWLFCTRKEYQKLEFFQTQETLLQTHLRDLLSEELTDPNQVSNIVDGFFSSVTEMHSVLNGDLDAVLEFDPAARSRNEVLLTYPGFFCIVVHRIANDLWHRNAGILPRLIAEFAHSRTGIDIHPAATIGKRFFIDHGTGIVIGETAIIGDNVKIYQGVTLGALSVSRDMVLQKRHPTIEDHVIIYSNATILGGKTVIGEGAVIGGNVWITNSIPAHSLVYHKSEMIIKDRMVFPDAIDFSI